MLNSKKQDLSPDDQLKLKAYFRAFVQTFSSIHVTSQVIDSGQVQIDAGSSATSILSFVASFAPFIGDALSQGISTIGEFMKSKEIKTNARIMKTMAADATELSQLIGKSGFQILMDKKKQQKILNTTEKDLKDISGNLFQKVLKFCSALDEKVDGILYTKMYKTIAERVGHNDANSLVEKYIKGDITPFGAQEQFVEETLKEQDPTQSLQGTAVSPTKQAEAPRSACCNLF